MFRRSAAPRVSDQKTTPFRACWRIKPNLEGLEDRKLLSSYHHHAAIPHDLVDAGGHSAHIAAVLVSHGRTTHPDVGAKKASAPLNFPVPLNKEIAHLKTLNRKANPWAPNKVHLLQDLALTHFNQLKLKATGVANGLDPAKNGFVLKKGKNGLPAYFTRPYNDSPGTTITWTPSYYDYRDAKSPNDNVFWVDFANASLGGGVFSTGFAQEEVMTLETPELANAAATGAFKIRIPNVAGTSPTGPEDGSPQPWIFHHYNHVMLIDGPTVEKQGGISKVTIDKLNKDVTLTAAHPVNILAIAAPKIVKSAQDTLSVLDDLFNTCVAGFTLAKRSTPAGERTLINTGRFGAGFFNNGIKIVFVIQELAARYVGVNLKFWGYVPADQPSDLHNGVVPEILSEYNDPFAAHTVGRLLTIAQENLKNYVDK
jgi:hypothetical protein